MSHRIKSMVNEQFKTIVHYSSFILHYNLSQKGREAI